MGRTEGGSGGAGLGCCREIVEMGGDGWVWKSGALAGPNQRLLLFGTLLFIGHLIRPVQGTLPGGYHWKAKGNIKSRYVIHVSHCPYS